MAVTEIGNPTATLLNCRGQLLDVSSPKVMGILNASPDSFYNPKITLEPDGPERNLEWWLQVGIPQYLEDGVDILDIGAVSTRPKAPPIDSDLEMERLLPYIEAVHHTFPELILSVDTTNAMVAAHAIEAGASIINDISGGQFDQNMYQVAAKYQTPYILMHIQGTPANMQDNPNYEDVVTDLLDYFIKRVQTLRQMGLKDIIIDPGFGFGKTVAHNYELLKHLEAFRMLGCPILAGISRKSMICKVLKVDPPQALNGTTVAHTLALLHGAHILRVHDVKEARQCIQIMEAYAGTVV